MELDSLASEFEIERGEPNGEGLEQGAGVGRVHVEVLLAYAPELHVDVVVVVLVYQLKVLHRCLVHASIEVQYKCLDLFVPLRWLVKEKHYLLCIVDLKLLLYRLIFIC